MITWTPYPNPDKGEYAYHGRLVLVAEYNGSWAVWHREGNTAPVTSTPHFLLYPQAERNIESAKAKAEAAAIKMLS